MSSRVVVRGVGEADKRLAKIQRRLTRERQAILLKAVRPVAADMKAAAPRGETGKLAKSIRARNGKAGTVRVGPKSPVTHLVVRGTRAHDIRPRRAPALKVGEGYAESVQHRARQPTRSSIASSSATPGSSRTRRGGSSSDE